MCRQISLTTTNNGADFIVLPEPQCSFDQIASTTIDGTSHLLRLVLRLQNTIKLATIIQQVYDMQSINKSQMESIQSTNLDSRMLDLPDEILLSILEFVRKKQDQGRVCLTNKKLHFMMKQIMYRRIVFGSCEDYFERPTSRSKILVLYDTLSANPELAGYVTRLELPAQGGKITKKDVRAITRRAVEVGLREKADVSKAWRQKVLRQYRKFTWASGFRHKNGMPKHAVFEFWALAASLLLLRTPNLMRLELHRHVYTEVPLFHQMHTNWTNLLPLALPKLIRIDLPLRKFQQYANVVQYLEEHIKNVETWSYTWQVVRAQYMIECQKMIHPYS